MTRRTAKQRRFQIHCNKCAPITDHNFRPSSIFSYPIYPNPSRLHMTSLLSAWEICHRFDDAYGESSKRYLLVS